VRRHGHRVENLDTDGEGDEKWLVLPRSCEVSLGHSLYRTQVRHERAVGM
jgi:hypothetical protein